MALAGGCLGKPGLAPSLGLVVQNEEMYLSAISDLLAHVMRPVGAGTAKTQFPRSPILSLVACSSLWVGG